MMDVLTASHKFQGEQSSRYDGKLQWPGVNGYPFLGDAAPLLKQQELEALPITGKTHEKAFDLNDSDDREYYNWVRDRIRNGLFVKDHEMRRWPEDKLYPIVYLEWTQCFVLGPPRSSIHEEVNNGTSTRFTLRRPN